MRVDEAGQDAVLGVVLEHAARIRRAVDVHAGAVQARVAGPHGVLTDELADLARQLVVEGRGDDAVARIAGALHVLVRVIGLHSVAVLADGVLLGHAGGAVVIDGQRLADLVDVDGHAQAVGAELGHLLIGELIHEGIPLRVVEIDVHHVHELDVRALAHRRELDALAAGQIGIVEQRVGGNAVGHRQLDRAAGHGARPVAAGVVGHGVAAAARIAVHVRVGKEALDLLARAVGGGVGLGVKVVVHRVDHLRIALGGHAVGDGLALDGEDVVGRGMGVVRDGQVVGARVEDVHAGAQRVIGGEEVLRHIDRHNLALARGQQRGLAVAGQLDGGLLDLVLAVVVGVGLLRVDLHGLLARDGAGVGHLHGHGVGGILALAGLFNRHVADLEVGVAQAVAERIGHDVAVDEVARVGRAQHDVLIARLGVAVAHVDAFLIDDILVELVRVRTEVVAARTLVGVGAEVVHDRVELVVHPPGIRQRAGRIDPAGEHVAHGVQARLADGADPQRRVHAVGLVAQEAHGHRIGAVDDDGDGADGAVVLELLEALEHGELVLVELEVVVVERVVDGDGHVIALAADAAHDVDDVLAVADGVAVVLLDLAPLDLGDLVGVALGFLFNVVVEQRLIDHVKARVAHHIDVVGRTGGVHRAGARAAVDRIEHGHADEGDLRAIGQRQGAVVILEQDDALALDLAHLGLARGLELGDRAELAVKVARVALGLALRQRADDLGGRRAQRGVNLSGDLAGDDIARKDDGAQARGHIQEHLFEGSSR